MRLASPSRLAAFWLAALAPTLALGGEGLNSPAGDVRLPSGLTVQYEYHYDRNALLDSREAGDALIALTRAGSLLRFDAKTLKPIGEWFGPVAATSLGRGEGDSVLVGFADGRICRVAPATLALDQVAKVDGGVRWVGWSPGGLVVVAEPTIMREWSDGVHRPTKYSVVHDLASGKVYKLTQKRRDPRSGEETTFDRQASAFLLDGKRRLWLGDDHGEWGGWCVRIDLGVGTIADVEGIKDHPDDPTPAWDGVYGFVEMPDGQVWAHGGTMHMGFTRGFIRRVDGPKVEPLYLYGNDDARKGHEEDEEIPEPGRPYLPITHVLPDRNGKLLVFSYSHIDRVDPGLKEWSNAHTLRVHYRPGRPDAGGAYLSIVAIHRLGDRLVFATAVDGYVEVVGDKDVAHTLPGQIGLDRPHQIIGSPDGTLFLPWDPSKPPWHLGPGGWEAVAIAPPFESRPDGRRVEGEKPAWDKTRVMVGPGGTVYTVSGEGWSGARMTARQDGGKWEVLGRETSSLNVAACFITPDGTPWNAWFGKLLRFADGAWVEVSAIPAAEPRPHRVEPERDVKPKEEEAFRMIDDGPKFLEVGWGLQALGDAGPPWLLLDGDHSQLLRLTHGPSFKDPRLDAVKIVESGVPLKVLDGIPWSKGELLLATDRGLRRFDVATDEVRREGTPSPDGPVSSIARDGLGRVWLGGEGLWLVDEDGRQIHDVGVLPMIGRTTVVTMAADPGRRDGVILSLGPRGVAYVQVAPGP